MASRGSDSSNPQTNDGLDLLLSEIRRDLQLLNDTHLLSERQVDRLRSFLANSYHESSTQQDEVTTTASEENLDIDNVLEEVRDKLLQLKKDEFRVQQYSKEILQLKNEKDRAVRELEKMKFANQELQVQVNVVSGILSESQQRNETLKKQNDKLTAELNELTSAHQRHQSDYREMQKKLQGIFEEMNAWCKVHQDVSAKQAQNQSKMAELAKRMGRVDATTFFLHQLKRQVEKTFKSPSDGLTSMRGAEVDAQGSCSSSSTAEVPRIAVNHRKTEQDNELELYKGQLLKNLQQLSNLRGAFAHR
ncbi:Hypothetical protein NTJ_02256 [Nesidiocoris tenuis]|uniref:Uncharacterized protein n=1 Tax=Nesidiocoris tenuis TaxID=355587 RepID=A0ABN7ABQ1_9HEMI|nr:Hypothetical protein NTJ_02256 [Nesidiocoris tenuis]